MFKVTMLSLEYVEKNRKTRNKSKIKVFITNRRLCRETLIRLTGLLEQSLLGQTGLLE